MKKNALLFLFISFQFIVNSQGYQWSKQIGAALSDFGRAIDLDAAGNVYTVGTFKLNPAVTTGEGSYNLTNNGGNDIFISKNDPNGNFQWIRTFGEVTNEDVNGLSLDDAGNMILIGTFQNTVDFDPGAGVFNMTSFGGTDIFLLKLDANGNFVWAQQFGGSTADGMAEVGALVIDGNGDIIFTSVFTGTADFDPSAGIYNLVSAGSEDSFVCKLTSNGTFVWAQRFGNSFNIDRSKAIAVDPSNNIYLTGQYYGTVDFNPGPGVNNMISVAITECFILKLDEFGNYLFSKSLQGANLSANTTGSSIVIDGNSDIILSGSFSNQLSDFDPGPGTFNLTPTGVDVFTLKLNNNGDFIWAKQISGSGQKTVYDIELDVNNNFYLTGHYDGSADFDMNAGVLTKTSAGGRDIYIAKYTTSGDLIWVHSIGGTGFDMGLGIQIGPDQSVYATGYFFNTADFNPGIGVNNMTSSGSGEIYILKLGYCEADNTIQTVSACESYTWINGTTYTTSNNTDTYVLSDLGGCDSTIQLNLTIHSSSATTDVITACDSYTWINGQTYTASNNTATHTLTTVAGCDSIVSLNLTINTSSSGTDVQTACGTYTWIDGITYYVSTSSPTFTLTNVVGCDSVVTLNLTINQESNVVNTITACDSYLWIDGNTYTSSTTTPSVTLTNSVGCDSIVTLHLIINQSTSSTQTVSACGSYTWINCVTYTSSTNTATHTIPNALGCDSVITLDLTIIAPSYSTDVHTVCAPFTWMDGNTYASSNYTATHTLTNVVGCDSIITLDLTVNQASEAHHYIQSCGPYTWINGVTYTSSTNSPTQVLTALSGCDSTLYLHLTINDIDPSLTVVDNVLTANQSGASYQWFDCITGANIPGETGQIFTALTDGTFAVRITLGSCVELSSCTLIDSQGIIEMENSGLIVYPNPTFNMVNIETDLLVESVSIYNTSGQLVQVETTKTFSTLDLARGTYLLKIKTTEGMIMRQLIKE